MPQIHRSSPVAGKAWQHLSFEERLIASFEKNEETGCWEWAKKTGSGYGSIDYKGKLLGAHRASYMFYNSADLSPEQCVLHKCDNRKCVNPDHLYVGDRKQNRKDFMERHPRAKEIVETGIKAGTEGVKRFWTSMDEEEKKQFCENRAKSQKLKRGAR